MNKTIGIPSPIHCAPPLCAEASDEMKLSDLTAIQAKFILDCLISEIYDLSKRSRDLSESEKLALSQLQALHRELEKTIKQAFK